MQLPPDAPQPRLCLVEKATPDQEYGYNLHAERGKDQFVGTVDKNSPAERAGLRMGDRIFAVNGVSIQGESHKKVVERIKQDVMKCELLVIDEEGANWYKEHNITVSPTLPNIIRITKDGESGRHSATNNNHEKPASGSPPPAAWYAPNGSAKDPVFVAPPPPAADMGGRPKPTLCHLEKKTVTDEFGFNLHAEKGKGHFIGAVDNGGIGDKAGLKMAQRIVGVNGILIHPTTPHKEVVTLIKKNPLSTTLLVAAEDVDAWYKQHNEAYSFDYADEGGAHHHGAHTHELAEVVVAAAVLHRLESVVEEAEELAHHHHEEELAPPAAAPRSRAPTEHDVAAAVLAAVTVEAVLEKEAEHLHHEHELQQQLQDEQHDDIMAAVFASVPPTPVEVTPVAQTPLEPAEEHLEEHHHHHHHEDHHEHAKELLVAAAIIHHEEKKIEKLEEELARVQEEVDRRETPVLTPEPTVRSTTSSYSKPVENGHSEVTHRKQSNDGPRDIFELSAAEARERLRANKRRDPRGLEMSLEEKYRIVSSM
ncbi:hypothetical protein PFISCL1PPCAC_16547 [Pristionchus fissidentatus]|uniref:PDZ domain-containing protein n=1 Tax=Pristionchus fissidentatus TaxID=1538716 RepID=A0AAV5W0A2_9BILA|nr:hypothetical protein PFISCL1PPCAC_16547 [Pristionchus fissidentatus]